MSISPTILLVGKMFSK